MEIFYFQQLYKTHGFLAKLKDFFAKLKNFFTNLKVSEIPVSVLAGKSVKK